MGLIAHSSGVTLFLSEPSNLACRGGLARAVPADDAGALHPTDSCGSASGATLPTSLPSELLVPYDRQVLLGSSSDGPQPVPDVHREGCPSAWIQVCKQTAAS